MGVRAVKLALCAALLATAASAQSSGDWRIDTFAGLAHVRDNVPATEDRLAAPFGVAADGAGNLYIADAGNNSIRKVDPSGIITTVAGTGEHDRFGRYDGDGGPASEAQLAVEPQQVVPGQTDSTDGRVGFKTSVWAVPIVAVEPVSEVLGTLGGGVIGVGVGPLT